MPSSNTSRSRAVVGLSYLGFISQALCAPATGNVQTCCLSLPEALSSTVALPAGAAYKSSIESYWARGEQELVPSCILRPQTAEDVSSAIQHLVANSCQFAVRGGGHSAGTGWANIQNGVTIDLQALNSTSVSADGSTVSVGAGQRLGNVFSALYERGLYVGGARASGIGAAGSTMGGKHTCARSIPPPVAKNETKSIPSGGVGYLYPKTGFAADSVAEYQVVLANGTIVQANKSTNSDLWRALPGGGSNFGVITNIVYDTIPLGDIWGGDVVWSSDSIAGLAQAFYDFAANPSYDPDTAVMMSYHWSPTDGNIIDNQFIYAKPAAKPAAFSGFYNVSGMVVDTATVTNIPAMSEAQNARSPSGFQQITFSTSYKNNVDVLKDVYNIFNATIASVSNIDGVSFSLSLEPLPQAFAAASAAKGGNMMGLDIPPEGVVVTLLSLTFSNAADYPAMDKLSENLLAQIDAAAAKRGASFGFIEMNHAKSSQKVLQSYGSRNLDFLRATAKNYDSTSVFQNLMPGGFKLC
ncbi:oxidoreductase [Apiospora phragmitis]|uniref:Oxidoreductase n=1 Tax=Apiospora phragmitis TaxID=2905665 RepID=A0ABR1TB21_9PEZI